MFAKLNKAYASKEVSAITYMYVDPNRLGLILIQTLFVQFINAFLKLPTEKYRNPASKITQIRSYDLFTGVPIGRGVYAKATALLQHRLVFVHIKTVYLGPHDFVTIPNCSF